MRCGEYHTALEIAALAERLKVSSVPWTKRRVQDLIAREGWDQSALARPRQGRGGGTEYHYSLFPERLTAALISENRASRELVTAQQVMVKQQQALTALGDARLTAKQRSVMEARAAVLQAVQTEMIERQCTKGTAVATIVERAKSDPSFMKIACQANDRGGKKRTLSRPTIYNWMKDYREAGLTALAPKATRDTHAFPHWFTVFMGYYAKPQAPTITDAMEDMRREARLNDLPSYDQVRRCLKKLDKTHGTQARHRGREGAQALKARMAYVVRDTSGLLPTSVYTADGKTFDAEVQHPRHGRPFRPEITTILDVATRVCVGWSVGLAENAKDVRDALRVAVEWHGVPAIFYVDNGSGFKNDALDNELTGFCARLGITKMHSLPYNSQARGIIERFNGSCYTKLSKNFSSYVGADMDREARQLSYKRTRKDLTITGTSALLPTWTEFMKAVGDAIADYNDSLHSGLEYRDRSGRKVRLTPNEAWQRAASDGFEPMMLSPVEIDDLFRPYERRRTSRAMVNHLTNSYFDMALQPYDGLDVLVGYDVHDAERVWVREIDTIDGEDAPGKLICVAKFEGNKTRYVPLSKEQKAIEDRAKSRTRRLQAHMDEVEAEANPARFLSQSAQPTSFPTISIVSPHPETIDAVANDDTSSAPTPAVSATATPSTPTVSRSGDRPPLSDDDAFARWVSEYPEKVTEKDRAHLQSMLRSKRARDFLQVHEHDLEALERLSKSVA